MDVIKVFTEEPVGLEPLVPDDDPDARRRQAAPESLGAPEPPGGPESLGAFLAGLAAPPQAAYARAYLAGTVLGPPHRVGLTAVGEAEAWVGPLVTWADGRRWTALEGGRARPLGPGEAVGVLHRPGATAALALGPASPGEGPPGEVLAEAAGAAAGRRDRLPALRALLDAGAAVLFPEPAHDGWDWSLWAPSPLRAPLADAFRQHPAAARRLWAPYQRARGEHTFYLEQWALDRLPDWVEEI